VADILDPAKFIGSSGSSEKDVDREPAPAAAAAGHLVSSPSTAAHIFEAILKNSLCCELVQSNNLWSCKMMAILNAILDF